MKKSVFDQIIGVTEDFDWSMLMKEVLTRTSHIAECDDGQGYLTQCFQLMETCICF